jgi:sulfate/thiosulfate transport system substrate-binding protein
MKKQIKTLAMLAFTGCAAVARADTVLLNVSYDVTREFFKDIDASFAVHWKSVTGEGVTVKQSHGGSSKQARAVLDGLEADVVTMNQAPDIDILSGAGKLIPSDWATRLPNNSAPYSSTILFVVRKGNPKGIKDWSDLVRPGVSVIIPNPKTSGNGRYSYLAAWGYALRQPGATETTARAYIQKLFGNVAVLDSGGRGATTTFAVHGIGDVLLTFESEVALLQHESGPDEFIKIMPSTSIRADNPVAWVDSYVQKHGTEKVARAYLEYLYSEEGQEIAAAHHFRPTSATVRTKHAVDFPDIAMFTVEDVAGSWAAAQKKHFSDGGIFDQIYENK